MANPKAKVNSDADVQDLDLSKYKSAELAENILEIVSIPGLFWQIAKTACLAIFIAVVAAIVVRTFAIAEGLTFFLITAYSIVLAVVFGVALGVLRVIHRNLINVDEILDHLLKISGYAVDDLSSLRSGQQQIPPGDVVLSKVYDDVIMPTVETVVSESLGIVGKPILWIYRRTLGSAVRYVIKRTAISKATPEELEKLRTGVADSVNALASDKTFETNLWLKRARDIVDSVGKGLQNYAMRPLFFVFIGFLILALAPIIAVLSVF